MLFIIEIVLTVLVWKKGWKALALIPLAVALFGGFMYGLWASANDVEMNLFATLPLDLVVIVVLAVMYSKPRTKDTPKQSEPTPPVEVKAEVKKEEEVVPVKPEEKK